MNEQTIAVCDNDENYALNLSSALDKVLYGRFRVLTFTGSDALCEYAADHEIGTAIISESSYEPDRMKHSAMSLIILKENGEFTADEATLVDRFQSRDELLESVIKVLPEGACISDACRTTGRKWKVIGIYSPIRRCLQTTFALSLGQMLGEDHKVLFMNFENYSGLSGWFNTEFGNDITDVLYYFDCERDKLSLRLPLMIHKAGSLDILPPPQSYFDAIDRTGAGWIDLFEEIEKITDYDFLILDLTDAMNGVLDVLSYCDRIYTMVRDDHISRAKLEQYEGWMIDHSRADIMGKTMKFDLPEFTDIPMDPGMLTRCELAGYVKGVIEEDVDRIGCNRS